MKVGGICGRMIKKKKKKMIIKRKKSKNLDRQLIDRHESRRTPRASPICFSPLQPPPHHPRYGTNHSKYIFSWKVTDYCNFNVKKMMGFITKRKTISRNGLSRMRNNLTKGRKERKKERKLVCYIFRLFCF